MDDNLDQLLYEADELIKTKRLTTSIHRKTTSDVFTDLYAILIDNTPLASTQSLTTIDVDDLLRDIDIASAPIQPITPKTDRSAKPLASSCRHEVPEACAGAGFFKQQKFCNALKAEIRETYSVEVAITKSLDQSVLKNPIYVIEFKNTDEQKVDEAKESVKTLFTAVATKVLDDQEGFWIRYPDCLRIVQGYGDQNERLHILCEYEATGLYISYFSKDKSTVLPNLCTSLATLDKIIQEKFLSLDISLPTTSDLTKENESHLAQDILKLENAMRSQAIIIVLEQRRIRLFGLLDIVKDVEKQIEEIKSKYASNTVKLNLEPKQIQYLFDIYENELKALETTYQETKIVENLKNGEFTAPSYLHDAVKQKILSMGTLSTPISFEIEKEAFRVVAHDERPNLIEIARQYKCQIEIEEDTKHHICQIAKATTQDHVSNELTASAIKIDEGDLADQKVDLVVICSISLFLVNGILEKAGTSVKQEYAEAKKFSSSEPFETNSGQLKCRKLLFLPWNIDVSSLKAFYQSIRTFVQKAVQHAIKAHHTSIAFPSIGCGQLNVDKNIVANEMLVEAQRQLLAANVLLQIIFVILPEQKDVYQAFQTKLENLQKGNVEIEDTQIPYQLTTLKITIISSNKEKQEECKKALIDYAQKTALEFELLKQEVLKKWTQPAINKFYKFCSSRHVIVEMTITIGYLKFFGLNESVRDAQVEYYRIQAKQSEHARLAAIAQDIIWAFKIDENTLEKYSPELNARIEDAYSSHVPTLNYPADNQSEEYTIDFITMTETCVNKQIQRSIIRHADFSMPKHWQMQSENVARFQVQVNSPEYQEIRSLFDKTMAGKYSEMQINRIQNKPWYTQYNSYRSFSTKKHTEKRLFHGCTRESTELIIHSFFNRSFAGVNGVVYGQGAYFSVRASYSHDYAKASTPNGERHMFVVNVLVGDSIFGNSSMKTPPAGYESTTDGDHIFVTYRDDQAYAAYLLVYK